MKTFAILLQLLGFTCRRAGANKWLRVPSNRLGDADVKRRMRYVRIDAAPAMAPGGGNWEEEQKGEVIMQLDDMGNFEAFEDVDESIMDAFVIEQVDDYSSEGDYESLQLRNYEI